MHHAPFGVRDYVAAMGVVLIWGTNFIAMKFALHDMTPFQLGALRYLFAVLPLILFVPRPKLALKWVVLYGLFQGVGQFGCLFLALKVGMSAALGSVLMQTQVFFTALFGFVLLGERASRALLAGLSIAALGIGCFAMNYLSPGADLGGTTALGFLLVLGSAAMWAASNLVVRRAQQSTPQFEVVPFMVWCSLVPIIPFILLSLAFDPPQAALRWRWVGAPWSTWLSLAYLGWFATIMAYALWTGLLKRHPMNRVAPFSLAVPVVGISSGILVFGDVISTWQWAGTALIAISLATVMFGARWLGGRQ
ncbi:EamA family transporter [Massilia psychrophila]|uniref:EamA family transporter n=1 Tax=Massilia psychrophila TaxID=1603353 RepID=A0A2G8T4C2_9BURK|nr:EamA family transporter [Massilia psychrophila]PIL40852.1 EamA family transporter [Massilia psychrophila]GGE72838.1 O-acetylserine/cysteine exporter [Massilia psychrophila]